MTSVSVAYFFTKQLNMEALRCDCYGCGNGLTTFDEVMYGICEEHRALMDDDDNYIGVCWNCLKATIIGPRRSNKGELIIKDKYIFSKTCRHCKEGSSGLDWMTINKDSEPTSYVEVLETDESGKARKCRIKQITDNITNISVVTSGRQQS